MSMRVSKQRSRRLFFEGLEQRAMLAGNVTASVSGQTLFIRGDSLGNGVVITQTGASNYLVTGIPDLGTATPTTVNGVAAFAANNVRNFEIDLSGGDDVLGIGNNTAYLADLALEATGGADPGPGVAADAVSIKGYANIRMGAGDDAVGIQLTTPSGVLIQTGAGADAVAVEAASEGALTVQTDSGNQSTDGADFARVRGVNVNGAVTVTTLSGDDSINLDTVSAGFIGAYSGVGTTIAGVTDDDSISGTTLTSRGAVHAISLVGNDGVFLSAVTAIHTLIDLGSGDDESSLSDASLRTANVYGAAGNDHFDLFSSTISINLHVDGGAGNDGLHVFGSTLGAATILGLGGTDGIWVNSTHVLNNLFIDLGAGDDNDSNLGGGFTAGLFLNTVTVDKVLTAFLGTGDDSAEGTGVTAGVGSTIYGGPGTDTLTDGGGNSPNIKNKEFEIFLP